MINLSLIRNEGNLKKSTANIFYGLFSILLGVAFVGISIESSNDPDSSSMFLFCSGIFFLIGLPLLIIGIRDDNYYKNHSKQFVEVNSIATLSEQSVLDRNLMELKFAPVVKRLIERKDADGLYQLLDCTDFELRKQAVIGLLKINKSIIDSRKIFYLLQDTKPEIRRIAYKIDFVGFDGLVANIAGLHDPVLSIRFESLDVLNRYHMEKAHEAVKRAASFDPDQRLRTLASTNYKSYISENKIDEKSLNKVTITASHNWFSSICLLEDLHPLVEKKSVEERNLLSILRPENCPDLMQLSYVVNALNQCREYFDKSLQISPGNENLMVNFMINCSNVAVEAFNYLAARYSPRVITSSGLPFYEYSICSMIMLNKISFQASNP